MFRPRFLARFLQLYQQSGYALSLLHGCIAGLVALVITRNLFKAANLEIVSYAASAIWIACGVTLGAFGTVGMGFQEDLLGLGAQVAGVTVGLFSFKFEKG